LDADEVERGAAVGEQCDRGRSVCCITSGKLRLGDEGIDLCPVVRVLGAPRQ
jgi:hypothetical protein